MAEKQLSAVEASASPSSEGEDAGVHQQRKVHWFRSTYTQALILGVCNFCAPGIWGAMNSLGGGGEQSPWLVNSANALTFCLMVLTCTFASVFVKYIGIKWTLILGAAGYAPFAAGLYCNNRFGSSWFVLFGAACCGLGAGIFWMAEAAIALSYPEPHNQGRFLGLWLSFRVGGQILGGAVNLGLNAKRNEQGSVGYAVYLVFVAIQSAAPFAGLLLSPPEKVQRTDGIPVSCGIPKEQSIWNELKATGKLFLGKKFLLIIPLIAQAVYAEAVFFTYQGLWFSVRARALGSFLSGIMAICSGNLLGAFIDRSSISLKTRSRYAFVFILATQGAWWIYGTINVTKYHKTQPVFDWDSPGFATAFTWFLLQVANFQANYMFLYFVIGNLAENSADVVRLSGLLRGTQSAAQAVSYGVASISIMGQVGNIYLNFALWFIALLPAWLVIKEFGVGVDTKLVRDEKVLEGSDKVL